MLGELQSNIIGIMRENSEKDPNEFLSIKEIHNRLIQNFKNKKAPSYNTVGTILHRLSEKGKIVSKEENNRIFYRYKDIKDKETNYMLSRFIKAFGVEGLTHLADKINTLNDQDLGNIFDQLEEEDTNR